MDTITIKNYIAQGNLDIAISEFLKLTEGKASHNQALALSQEMSQIINNKIVMIIDTVEESKAKMKLSASLIAALDLYEQQNQSNNRKPTEPQESAKKEILFLYAGPEGKNELRFSEEIAKIDEALQLGEMKDKFTITTKGTVKAEDLSSIIRKAKPKVLHISVHASKAQGLLFEDRNRLTQAVTVNVFKNVIRRIVDNNTIECIIINACNSADHAKAIAEFVPYIIGMQDFIPDEAAIAFTRGFYRALFNGESYDIAYEEGIAAIELLGMEPEGELEVADIPMLITKIN